MKIIGSDYDGTLNRGGMTDEKFAAIQSWRDAGNKFGIITGRSPHHREYLAKEYPIFKYDFLAACNGGLIIDQNGEIICDSRCDTVPLTELAADLFSWGCVEAHVDGAQSIIVLPEFDGDLPVGIEKQIISLRDATKVNYFNQVSVQLPSHKASAEVVNKINLKYSGRLNALLNGECIDIVPANVNKARGMYRVMEHFGASHGDIITVGDNINDIDMLREFRSYGMRSGADEIFEFTDGIVGDITEIFEKESV
ncbi:MAG: HAD-IIB family hydrolase [Clostridia bacterium]|nr:HAD-IIB family hydrolase [Clostridia bacterium]